MMFETRKILGDESIAITVTCARVPVTYSHSESVNLQTREPLEVEEARALLEAMPGLTLVDPYPTAAGAAGHDEVFVGRLRRDPSHERGLQMWVVSDNLRKGAATNAVQLAELLTRAGSSARAPRRNVNCGIEETSPGGRGSHRPALTSLYARQDGARRFPPRALPPQSAVLRFSHRAPPTTERRPVDHRRRAHDVLVHAELLGLEPEGEADELGQVQHRHPELAARRPSRPAAAAGRG